ncbi:MAG TPA: Gfo/Idh/MocA family oxidoreductase, partial [Armatimonadetes bacterium]|nr:Gfo/Idh/MocA family oxidoreductase [Armatimonadota bacterium]
MSEERMSRREFLTKSATGAAVMALGSLAFVPERVWGANDRISLGIVGAGARGNALMEWAQRLSKSHNVEFTAVCDIWNQRRERAAKKVKNWTGKEPRRCRTIHEICELDDVDVLIIATADFQHAYHLTIAVRAGKDAYVEKPLSCHFEQIKEAYKAVKETGRIVQMGTQRRGSGKYFGAREFIKSGALGKVTYVEVCQPLFQQRWRIYGAEKSIRPEDTNWREFLRWFDPKDYPWNPRHYREFRLFWPFSSGIPCQWMSHQIDVINLALDELPRYAMARGGVYLWKDGRTNPDTFECLLEYPSGCIVRYHMRLGNSLNGRGITIYGTNGTMELDAGIAYGDGGGGEVGRGFAVVA